MGDSFRKRPAMSIAMSAILVALFAVIVSVLGGIYAGQKERNVSATQTTELSLSVQYDLGLDNLNAGLYDLALQRFYWIHERQPGYPGLNEAITEAEALKASADTVLNPVMTGENSEVDLGELFSEVENRHDANDWARVIEISDEIATIDSNYRKTELEEMLFTALKTLGLSYIRGDRLEEGIFLLDRAASMKPLDDVSEGEIYLANLYITAKSYWNINWPVTIANLDAILEVAPDYKDASQKVFDAHVLFGDQLVALKAYCDAEIQYTAASEIKASQELQEKLTQAHEFCLNPPIDTPTPPISLTEASPTASGTTEP